MASSASAVDKYPFKRTRLVVDLLRADAEKSNLLKDLDKDLDQAQVHLQNTTNAKTLESTLGHAVSNATLNDRAKVLQDIARVADDDANLSKALAADPSVSGVKSIARKFNVADLEQLAHPTASQSAGQATSAATLVSTAADQHSTRNVARSVRRNLFHEEPTLVLRKMVEDGEIPFDGDDGGLVRKGVLSTFDIQNDIFMRQAGKLPSFAHKEELKGSDVPIRKKVASHISALRRLNPLTDDPAVLPPVMKAGFTSARQIASVPLSPFIKHVSSHFLDFSDAVQDEDAKAAVQMHKRAQDAAIHSSLALKTALQRLRGIGIRAIDGKIGRLPFPLPHPIVTVAGQRSVINLQQLFGSIDYCDCSDCASVTSPTAYFVELLQFLRNNNLKETYAPGWDGTALGMLLRRRPDLADLELTCANANTVLPYIDLSNEIMESFTVHRKAYDDDTNVPKQTILETFNVEDGTVSSALLAQPQNTNYKAYCIVKDANYPFTLPYHQPLDELRILLSFLGTSRLEILNTFVASDENFSKALREFQHVARARAEAAEVLLLTPEQYKLLTKEVFYPKEYLDYIEGRQLSKSEFEQKIFISPVYVYWGYTSEGDMRSLDETAQVGLTFVQKQFLKRSGLTYVDLVQLLQTSYVNPNYPRGWALFFMERLRWSYQYLQTLVDTGPDKYERLIQFLVKNQPAAELFEEMRQLWMKDRQSVDPSLTLDDLLRLPNGISWCDCSCSADQIWKCWVLQYFELVGKLLVLDSRDGSVFGTEGWLALRVEQPVVRPPALTILHGLSSPATDLVNGPAAVANENASASDASASDNEAPDADTPESADQEIGYLQRDGHIITTPSDGMVTVIGHVTPDGRVVDETGNLFSTKYKLDSLTELNLWSIDKITIIGEVSASDSTITLTSDDNSSRVAQWQPVQQTCNIEKVRLIRLTGKPASVHDFDRMHRFIRLWRQLGWTINDLDVALAAPVASATNDESSSGKAGNPVHPSQGSSGDKRPVLPATWADFDDRCADDCGDDGDGDGDDCPKCSLHGSSTWQPPTPVEITAATINNLAAIKQIVDRTGLDLPHLLCLWADISTHGTPLSMYAQLFLTRDLAAMDPVFAADANGNYLTFAEPERLATHLPVVMAAFGIQKLADFQSILSLCGLHMTSDLTIHSLSQVFRWVLLAQILGLPVSALSAYNSLFENPFNGPPHFLQLLKDWDRVNASGFSLKQLAYVINDQQVDVLSPLGPTKVQTLQTTKQLIDGMTAIQTQYPSPEPNDVATDAKVAPLLALIYDPATAKTIQSLLDGTSLWTADAPIGLTVAIPPSLNKVKYVSDPGDPTKAPSATLQMTGILTASEVKQLIDLESSQASWSAAVTNLMKLPFSWFEDTLSAVFSRDVHATDVLLAGDVASQTPPATDSDPTPAPVPGTAPTKLTFFLTYYIPYLRQTLCDKLVVDTMSAVAGTSSDVTATLLQDIIKVGSTSALLALRNIQPSAQQDTADWNGYLLAPATDTYTIIITSNTNPGTVMVDNLSLIFTLQQDSVTEWESQAIKLQAGSLYKFFVPSRPATQLSWKTSTGIRSSIPDSSLLPDVAVSASSEVFTKIVKAGIVVSGFSLTPTEITYLSTHPADFAAVDFNALKLPAWMRLQSYTAMRDSLPAPPATLIDLFTWAGSKEPALSELQSRILLSTRWDSEATALQALLQPEHFGLKPHAFRNELPLQKLRKAMDVVKMISINVSMLFTWAKPVRKFWDMHADAASLRKALRSRFKIADWEQAILPLYNTLREHQRDALIAYSLTDQNVIDAGVVDADGLFEFFLIDVQMSSCLQTSRIKQAISSVQQFVQRCLLGLETLPHTSTGSVVPIDTHRWNWMSRQTVFTAARSVFLWPENVLFSALRDDKSPFFRDFESELLQKDVDSQAVATAYRNYLGKLDEVSSLEVVGLFVENLFPEADGTQNPKTLHIVARTKHEPYNYYYRQYDLSSKLWTALEKMPNDIPNYSNEKTADNKQPEPESGAYCTPVVWNGRILVFFPQITTKTIAISQTPGSTPPKVGSIKPWEVKMCYVERQNGKWTSKVVSAESVMERIPDTPTDYIPPLISDFAFIPRLYDDPNSGTQDPKKLLSIDVFCRLNPDPPAPANPPPTTKPQRYATPVGRFDFLKGRLVRSQNPAFPPLGDGDTRVPVHFGKIELLIPVFGGGDTVGPTVLYSWQWNATDGGPWPLSGYPMVEFDASEMTLVLSDSSNDTIALGHDFIHEALGTMSDTDDISALYKYLRTLPSSAIDVNFGAGPRYHELSAPYALYNWELMFYMPWMLMEKFQDKSQLDRALQMCNLVFDPNTNSDDGSAGWKFQPFQHVIAKDDLDSFFQSLVPNNPNIDITTWRDDPFVPFGLARLHPLSFMKMYVMRYLQLYINYGDYYFRQNTSERVPLAIQCYAQASHVYGPAGQLIPSSGKKEAQTYRRLLERFDAFDNAVVDLELEFPFSNQIAAQEPIGFTGRIDTPVNLANLFGSASAGYFCIPRNLQLQTLRDTIDDRLFKLRHCQDINGVVQHLPLWDPPIDPALLVEATAAGLSIDSVVNDLYSSMPNYRFFFLLQKAHEVTSDLKNFLGAFLQATERKDIEALTAMRQRQEVNMGDLIMTVKQAQLDEANQSLAVLQQNRLAPAFRMGHFLRLIGGDLSKIPADESSAFTEIEGVFEQIIDDSGLKATSGEMEEQVLATASLAINAGLGVLELTSSTLSAAPGVMEVAAPWGVGVVTSEGPQNFAAALSALSRGGKILADGTAGMSSLASRRNALLHAMQDRIQMANSAGYEIKSIDAQIVAQRIRIDIASKEIANQQQANDNSREVQDFLSSKYTNQDLYAYLQSTSSQLCRQAYDLAYQLARKAERLYQFERPTDASKSFIKFGYWDQAHDGLLAADALDLDLRQLEAAYQETRGHDFEITKSVSLRQVSPIQLMTLRATGKCEIILPETLYDMDFPGHYMRRIKSVTLTMPCILGPYTGVNATLRLLDHKMRVSSVATDSTYPESTNGPGLDPRFATSSVPISSIATSNAQGDAGVFEIALNNERYLPFEGAGAISHWQLSLPTISGPTSTALRPFDYSTITDVVLSIRYTSLDGGDKLASSAAATVRAQAQQIQDLAVGSGLFCIFDLKAEFATQWAQFIAPLGTPGADRVLRLASVQNRLPMITLGAKKVTATEIRLYSTVDLPVGSLKLAPVPATSGAGAGLASEPVTFSEADAVGKLRAYVSTSNPQVDITGSWDIKVVAPDGAGVDLSGRGEGMWLIVKYSIKL